MTKIEENLRLLGLDEYIEVFQENNIDDESFLLLGENDLKELIPKIGPRLKLKKLINGINMLDRETRQDVNRSKELKEVNTSGSEDYDTVENTPDCTSNLKFVQEDQNTVKKILTESLDGRALMKEGLSDGGLLKEGSRRKLSQIVINHYMENNPDFKISTEEFYRLALDIVTLFPRESIVVYYSAYLSGKDRAAKKNASGKLYESYINRRRQLRQRGDLAHTRRQSSISSCSLRSNDSATADTATASETSEPEDYDDNLSFLKNNVEPWGKVAECWTATSTHRLKNLYNGQQGGLHYTRRIYSEEDPKSIKSVCLVLLPYIINISPARKRKGRDNVKFSRSEITYAFIHQVASEVEVTPSIIERREVLAKPQRTMQPYCHICRGRMY